MFGDYFEIGWQHILNLAAWDHLLFIIALAAIYTFKEWRNVLVLVTAFTIGHTLTLILATFNLVRFNSAWIEFLIPCTIAATAVINIFQKKITPKSIRINYFLALFFGLIHGMGFASGLRSLLGKETSVTIPLLGFNLGIEAGQIVSVFFILLTAFIVLTLLKANRRDWVLFLSGGAFFSSAALAIQRIPF